VLVVFGDYDAMPLRTFAVDHGGALLERWQFFDPLAICAGGLDGALIASETAALQGLPFSLISIQPLAVSALSVPAMAAERAWVQEALSSYRECIVVRSPAF
jgi:hypothetical protein